MKRLLPVLLSLLCVTASAQDYTRSPMKFSHLWSEGTIILTTGDTLHCKLRYNRSSLDGVVQVLDGDQMVSITTPFIKSFSYFDEAKQSDRSYINMTLPAFRAEQQQFLVEMLYDDENYGIINQRTYEMPYQDVELIRFIGKPVPVYKKFIIKKSTGELIPLSRAHIMELLDDKKEQVSAFIHDNRIRFKAVADFVDVFAFYHSL